MSNGKSIGSLYINASKDAGPEVQGKIDQIVAYIRENGYISFSIKADRLGQLPADNKGYVKFKGYSNKFNNDNFYIPDPVTTGVRSDGGRTAPQTAGNTSGVTLDL